MSIVYSYKWVIAHVPGEDNPAYLLNNHADVGWEIVPESFSFIDYGTRVLMRRPAGYDDPK